MTDSTPVQTAAQSTVDTAKADVATAAARRPWAVIAWSAMAGAIVGAIIAWAVL